MRDRIVELAADHNHGDSGQALLRKGEMPIPRRQMCCSRCRIYCGRLMIAAILTWTASSVIEIEAYAFTAAERNEAPRIFHQRDCQIDG
ncbi:hypothetical protein [Nonomuraea diastatica]|uniref:Uncharacterized protein n=1 Tax=Nonomuraea diastatica TaxID=1848329 RepID=A0A4R4VS47_9ACTN|nr:hypothetical protein [Nonomuraea diastatica]TDD05424.1 hypothetical protein E1294_49560 [Nonomuraea diastatica]